MRTLAAETANIPKNLQSSRLKDQRALLKKDIQGWEQLRSVYIPGLVQLLSEQGTHMAGVWDTNTNPEEVLLWLPSSIPTDRRRAACVEGISESELTLRTAQCASSLQGLRQVLRLKTRMVYFKHKNVRGQREGTRSRSVIDRVHKRALRLVQKYRAARQAKVKLEGPGEWEQIYRELKNDDVRSYAVKKKKADADRRGIWEDGHEPPQPRQADIFESESSSSESEIEMEEDIARLTEKQLLNLRKKGTGETHKELSWIWTTTGTLNASNKETDRILRAEWAKSRARTHCAQEEVKLVLEEMRRVLGFLDHSARKWGERIVQRDGLNGALMEGLQSYANKQILLQQSLAQNFRVLWKIPLRDIDRVDAAPDSALDVENSHDKDNEEGDDGDGDEDEDDDNDDDEEDNNQGAHDTANNRDPDDSDENEDEDEDDEDDDQGPDDTANNGDPDDNDYQDVGHDNSTGNCEDGQ